MNYSDQLNQTANALQKVVNDMVRRNKTDKAGMVAKIQNDLENLAFELSDNKVEIVLESTCGCIVEKHNRARKPPLYVIAGQEYGITENPLAWAFNGSSDKYMASLAIDANCPHQ